MQRSFVKVNSGAKELANFEAVAEAEAKKIAKFETSIEKISRGLFRKTIKDMGVKFTIPTKAVDRYSDFHKWAKVARSQLNENLTFKNEMTKEVAEFLNSLNIVKKGVPKTFKEGQVFVENSFFRYWLVYMPAPISSFISKNNTDTYYKIHHHPAAREIIRENSYGEAYTEAFVDALVIGLKSTFIKTEIDKSKFFLDEPVILEIKELDQYRNGSKESVENDLNINSISKDNITTSRSENNVYDPKFLGRTLHEQLQKALVDQLGHGSDSMKASPDFTIYGDLFAQKAYEAGIPKSSTENLQVKAEELYEYREFVIEWLNQVRSEVSNRDQSARNLGLGTVWDSIDINLMLPKDMAFNTRDPRLKYRELITEREAFNEKATDRPDRGLRHSNNAQAFRSETVNVEASTMRLKNDVDRAIRDSINSINRFIWWQKSKKQWSSYTFEQKKEIVEDLVRDYKILLNRVRELHKKEHLFMTITSDLNGMPKASVNSRSLILIGEVIRDVRRSVRELSEILKEAEDVNFKFETNFDPISRLGIIKYILKDLYWIKDPTKILEFENNGLSQF